MYYVKDPFTGDVQGPITETKLRELAASGNIDGTWEVSKSNTGPWVLASRIKGLNFDASTRSNEEDGNRIPAPPVSATPPVVSQSIKHYQAVQTAISNSWFSGFFDFKFKTFIYPSLIRLAYKIFTILWAIWILFWTIALEIVILYTGLSNLSVNFAQATTALFVAIVFPFLLAVVWLLIQAAVRTGFEIIMVVFNIHDTLNAQTKALELLSSEKP